MWVLWLQLLHLVVSHDHVGRHIATISDNVCEYPINCLHLISHLPCFAHTHTHTHTHARTHAHTHKTHTYNCSLKNMIAVTYHVWLAVVLIVSTDRQATIDVLCSFSGVYRLKRQFLLLSRVSLRPLHMFGFMREGACLPRKRHI